MFHSSILPIQFAAMCKAQSIGLYECNSILSKIVLIARYNN